MDRNALKQQAKDALKGKWNGATTCVIIYTLVQAITYAPAYMGRQNSNVSLFLSAFTLVLSLFVLIHMDFAFSALALRALHGEGIRGTDIFLGFRQYGRILKKKLLEKPKVFLALLLFVVPGIMLSYSYAMSDFILADDESISPSQALEKSKAMMKGHRFELFRLHLSFLGWLLLTVLTLDVLALYTTPYIITTHAAFYERLKAEGAAIEE